MDNISIARLLDETASLLEIDSADPFRIRSYRRAAEAVEQQTTQLSTIADDPKALLAIPGIGKGMAANIVFLLTTGTMPLREELLQKYKPTMLDLLRLPGMGPKTVALVWSACQVCDIDGLEAAAKAGHLTKLPRMGEKFVIKLLKGIEDHRKNSSRFRIDKAQQHADTIINLIRAFPGIDEIIPAGSLRRGRETVGDLDLLATGPACEPDVVSAAVEHVASLPLIDKLIAKGQNKVSFTLRNNLQVDVRLLPGASYGAALQYFTGSKMHNVALRQRAIKRGLTLSEYALLRLEDNVIVAAASEADIYNALDLDYIPPELRENGGELEAAATHNLPQLITLADIRGDLHMHTEATDGRDTIRQMAEAALLRGLNYIAITDHSKNLAMTNGLDDTRALAHIKRIREVDAQLQQDLVALNESLARDTPPTNSRISNLWDLLKTSSSRPDHNIADPSQASSSRPEAAHFAAAAERPPHFADATTRPPLTLPLTFRILPGIEVDILADGALDLDDSTLAQMDIVVASVHSHFNQAADEMTARVLRALENPHVRILGHPTGRKVLGREPYAINIDTILKQAAKLGVAVEHNASPARADLNDLHLRLAKKHNCKIVINTDAHATEELDQMRYGITQLRRAWLSPADILNTQPTAEALLKNLRPKP
ncbi:helix-hairpin-helix domain-containing protein [Tunturiibacter gelidoferens]|uniref:DNA polymerase (Family 10) n=1 Tax=Tunturiibacter gelidiferens TaxID=3069689 RepID=A0ACC5NTU2_9BACT|nr:helix-hairpin-helix domain-containing protein [Edaphobacter lichenicola]MBB5337984.1 DNA polymerase (family 10) [Edaphobacter lichenicola]